MKTFTINIDHNHSNNPTCVQNQVTDSTGYQIFTTKVDNQICYTLAAYEQYSGSTIGNQAFTTSVSELLVQRALAVVFCYQLEDLIIE